MPLHYTAVQVQIIARTLTEKGKQTKPLLSTGKTLDKIWEKQSGPPQPPDIAELETRPSSPAPGTKPLGAKRKWSAVLNSEQGLHMEVEVLPAFIASRGGHQMASRVGRQDEGRRESSARKGSITTPGPPENWLPSAATLFSPSPPWRVDEEVAELQTPELHQPDWCEIIDEDTSAAPPCHS
jgi:hypothetical protein